MQGARGRSSSEGRSSGRPCAVVLPFLSPASGERNGRDGSFIQAATDEFSEFWARALTAPDGRAGRICRRARRLLLKARDDAAARLR